MSGTRHSVRSGNLQTIYMQRITGQSEQCKTRAETCRALSEDLSFDSIQRTQFAEMAEHWQALAASYELAEEISSFIQWQSHRVEPPPWWYQADDELSG